MATGEGGKAQSWAAQIKPKRKSTDEETNQLNETNFVLVTDILQHCDKFPGDVIHISTHCMKLKSKQTKLAQQAETLSTAFANFGTLKSLDEDFLMAWILDNSDLVVDDLLAARKQDKDAAYLIVSNGTQVPLGFRLPSELNSKEIMNTFLTQRHQQTGKRIADFKADDCLSSDGKLSFLNRSFVLT